MMTTQTANIQTSAPEIRKGMLQRFRQIVITLLIQAAILFIAAGRLDWGMAWLYLAASIGFFIVNATLLLPKHRDLIAERGKINKDAKTWDKWLAFLIVVAFPLTMFLVAGLDQRFGWSPQFPWLMPMFALFIWIAGSALWSWAMVSNNFFSGLVRIQSERGHAVATTGPYRFVRHPGYVGLILFSVAPPFILGSFWALIPASLIVALTVVRTALEDRTLQCELNGYQEYTRQVRYRLAPGLW